MVTERFAPGLNAHGPSSIAVRDFNANQKLDLATAEANSNSVSIFLGDGNGAFHAIYSSIVGDRALSIAAGKINRDGKIDLVVVNTNSNEVSVLLGHGKWQWDVSAAPELPGRKARSGRS